MKKILILGVGAQGSTVAQRMDEEPNVSEIICADYDEKAVSELVGILKKGKGMKVDASDIESIKAAAEGVDLIVNGLPLQFGKNVLEAALAVKTNYQDFAATESIHKDWVEGIKIMYDEYGKRFKEIGKTAVIA
ncbi:saccharopine dehydrogenase NADP-binding domain-containing protein, partial [Intestinibacillus massiliensis]|nr:saccharopine dehydrogenase NADP-binding domain-containing protein [Intestinibacillus massiliensis]